MEICGRYNFSLLDEIVRINVESKIQTLIDNKFIFAHQ